ncbi:MAG: RNA polymerase sigma-54 factor, partial [Planctomycetota bacterium]
RLNPVPGSAFGEAAAPTLLPDVRVELIDGEYQVFLEDSWLPPLGVNRYYLRQLKEGNLDDETKEYIKKKLKSARWLIDAIEQRRSTLYNVSSEIMKAQEKFLDKGDEALKPLRMQEIADRAGVHVSTVSRAISDKYIQTPRGVYPLKHFFSGGLEKDNGESESWEAVRQKLSQIVKHEDKSDPLSDEQISEKLEEQGISIARRTVSKYRRNMGIPSARKRKEY